MSNFSPERAVLCSLRFLAVYILVCFFSLTPKSFIGLSDAHAQSPSPEQIEMAKQQLGVDIEDFVKDTTKETGIGHQYDDFVIESKKIQDKKSLSAYLGFNDFENRFGENLFSNERVDFKIADDSQAPEDYVLGLGDQIIVQYYGAESKEFALEIDRSGSILLPKIGPVILNGLKLGEARRLIRSRVEAQLVGVNAAISVGKTKFINIFVAGNVNTPGVYSMPALSRVTHALYIAGGITDLGTYRNIQVKRQGEIVGSLDLYDFLVFGDNSSDINLHPNDVVLVGPADVNIQIRGAAKRPGVYEVKSDEKIEDIINIFGGFSPGADIENIAYSTLSSEASNGLINFKTSQKIKFYDGDNLFIKFKPSSYVLINENIKNNYKSSAIRVKIQGEVRFPGEYLLHNGDKISTLIDRAGGLTDNAFLDGAVFTRENVRQREALRAKELADQVRRVVVSTSQTQSDNLFDKKSFEFISQQLENYGGVGRVVVDINRAIAGRADADIKLVDGDALFVPTRSNTVSVFGEVRRESSYIYNKKYAIDDYITLSAGMTRLADEDNIYIVRANGLVEMPTGNWFKFGASRVLREGDAIIVPVDYSYRDALPFYKDVISIVYQGAVAIAAIGGL